MSTAHRVHLDEDTVESYALGKLSEEEESLVEEHLLICEDCRQLVEREDDFIRTYRLAHNRMRAAEVARPGSWWKRFLRLRPLHLSAALAVCCLAAVLYRPGPVADFDASLTATRGAFDSVQTVTAGARLNLTLDLRGLPPADSLVAELASAEGSVLWTSAFRSSGDSITLRPEPRLSAGTHWLRLYTADSKRTLLREFGIRAK